jgi:hypothetical protein
LAGRVGLCYDEVSDLGTRLTAPTKIAFPTKTNPISRLSCI